MSGSSRFLDKFSQFIDKYKLIRRDDRILVGFSGGADSTALLLALWHIRPRYNCSVLAAHVNYNLRGDESTAEMEHVKQFCFDRNISLVVKSVKMDNNSNLESEARELRFQYFKELVKLYKLNKIALGHNRYDQAETLLLRLMRGSGYSGLKGITPLSHNLIHPLLDFTREEISDFLNTEKVGWCEDSSNKDNKYTRNLVRNELIPWITDNMNPRIVDKLHLSARIFSETDEILQEIARRRLQKAQINRLKDEFKVSLGILRKTRSVLRFYIYKELYAQVCGQDKDFYHANFDEIENILYAKGSKEVLLPHEVHVLKEYNELIFTTSRATGEANAKSSREITGIRNRLTFEDNRIIMKKLKKLPQKRNLYEDSNKVYLDLDNIKFPLKLRHRIPGDKFRPLGMNHTKKLKNFFIDEKIPKFERDKVLLFCDTEKILWIAGFRIDNRVAITPSTANILQLRIEKIAHSKARPAERIKKKDRHAS